MKWINKLEGEGCHSIINMVYESCELWVLWAHAPYNSSSYETKNVLVKIPMIFYFFSKINTYTRSSRVGCLPLNHSSFILDAEKEKNEVWNDFSFRSLGNKCVMSTVIMFIDYSMRFIFSRKRAFLFEKCVYICTSYIK